MVKLQDLKDDSISSYQTQIERLNRMGANTHNIEETVFKTVAEVRKGTQSLVIYGEPQSGKTEMMICLTAKLLDEGFKCIVVLITDSLDLLMQNQSRFRLSQLTPPPKTLDELIQNSHQISKSGTPVIVFSKKNSKDLEKLNVALRKFRTKIVIDDEGDYATPNSRINSRDNEASKINERVSQLVDFDSGGVWVGVTATPARLDLNATLKNDKKAWVRFKPHSHYVGVETFFPLNPISKHSFKLNLLNGQFNQRKEIKNALQRFVVTVALRNTDSQLTKQNYSMVIHTSGKKEDHRADHEVTQEFFHDLESESQKLYDGLESLLSKQEENRILDSLKYIYMNRQNYIIRTVNSETDRKTENIKIVTEPQAPFTVAIGGNIISRGVTFDNLLSLFFTRNTEGRMQQDTYIQRARMFGNRKPYLSDLEITVPTSLYEDWHRLFVLHNLALVSVESGDPLWLEEGRIRAVSANSIDKSRLSMSSGEIKSEIFNVKPALLRALELKRVGYESFRELVNLLPSVDLLPPYLVQFVENVRPSEDQSLVIHKHRLISESTYTDVKNLDRKRSHFGGSEIRENPKAIHHFMLVHNKHQRGRIIYKYLSNRGTLRFLKLD